MLILFGEKRRRALQGNDAKYSLELDEKDRLSHVYFGATSISATTRRATIEH